MPLAGFDGDQSRATKWQLIMVLISNFLSPLHFLTYCITSYIRLSEGLPEVLFPSGFPRVTAQQGKRGE